MRIVGMGFSICNTRLASSSSLLESSEVDGTSADFHNAMRQFNCYLMSIFEMGCADVRFFFLSSKNQKIYAKFLSKWNRRKFMLADTSNVEHTAQRNITYRLFG